MWEWLLAAANSKLETAHEKEIGQAKSPLQGLEEAEGTRAGRICVNYESSSTVCAGMEMGESEI